MDSYRVVLADDHVLIRSGIKMMLDKIEGLKVVGEANDGLQLLNCLKELTPHLIVLDISMPNLRGIEAIHEIKTTKPDVKILMLTMHNDVNLLHLAISAGADGYLLKEDAEVEIFSAVEAIRRGKIYVSPLLSEDMASLWARMSRGERRPQLEDPPLTVREKEILKMIAEGKSRKEIADLLFISSYTVDHHRANAMNKLDLKTTADLVKYALQKNYV